MTTKLIIKHVWVNQQAITNRDLEIISSKQSSIYRNEIDILLNIGCGDYPHPIQLKGISRLLRGEVDYRSSWVHIFAMNLCEYNDDILFKLDNNIPIMIPDYDNNRFWVIGESKQLIMRNVNDELAELCGIWVR